ncbi:MAG: RNA 2',3'-cyclic phosphodiesterase [Candidatus Omnitrophica bacterium]|nr:RNA 2',3'-cyclic phosphodiesterase [Candidatus Omnitrophota bacterium]
MRTFIAIELPQHIKDRLAELQARLKQSGADVKWVEPKNIHLTLKFLGETSDEKLPKIIEAMESVAQNKKRFTARLFCLGAFPKLNFPRVIWVSIDLGDEEVKKIAQGLEEKMEKIGYLKEERPFSSHISIGRVRSVLNKENLIRDLKALENYCAKEKLEFDVAGITLLKSTLGSGGPVYEALKQAKLTTT